VSEDRSDGNRPSGEADADSEGTRLSGEGDAGSDTEFPWREGEGMPDTVAEAAEGPTDTRVHPEQSPGLHSDVEALEDIEVSRDVEIGEADPGELAASDTEPLADASTARKLSDLAGDDPVDRRRAALALSEADRSEAVVAALGTAALDDADGDVRQFAVEALAKLGGEAAGEVALAVTRDDDHWVRAEAVVALDRLDRDRYEDQIAAAVEDDHHAVRRNAAISLFKQRGEDAADVLLDLADDPSERVREWAVHLLAGVDDDRARETLRRLADDEGEAHVVKTTAARSLEADPGAFRRQFSGALEESTTDLPGEGRLNRQPDL
jgi:hypothetical protein